MTKKLMRWLWGVAEDADFAGLFPRSFWSWLLRVCDRYHGYRPGERWVIVPNSGDAQGPP